MMLDDAIDKGKGLQVAARLACSPRTVPSTASQGEAAELNESWVLHRKPLLMSLGYPLWTLKQSNHR